MMKAFLPLMMLAAMPFAAEAKHTTPVAVANGHDSECCDHVHQAKWAQFYFIRTWLCEQKVCPDQAVKWDPCKGFASESIKINKRCPTDIIIKEPGLYLIEYSVTGEVHCGEEGTVLQFSLFANGKRVKGSTFAVADAENGEEEQLNGQVVVNVCERNTVLKLVNEGPSTVILDSDVAEDGCIPNVTAEIFIQKLPC